MQNIELEDLKSLTNSDLSEVYDLNQSLTPKLGSLLNTQHLERLIEMSDCSKALKINGKIAAFMVLGKILHMNQETIITSMKNMTNFST